jgi:hypothetical protein
VFRLATVRGAGYRELFVSPSELVEASGAEKRDDLEGFRAGAPVGKRVGIARAAQQHITILNYRGMYSMLRLGSFTAGYCDIELVRPGHTLK